MAKTFYHSNVILYDNNNKYHAKWLKITILYFITFHYFLLLFGTFIQTKNNCLTRDNTSLNKPNFLTKGKFKVPDNYNFKSNSFLYLKLCSPASCLPKSRYLTMLPDSLDCKIMG